MKKNNKNRKGFTIVELVIVIAVIAILAGVLIPTFSGVVTKANESKVLQEARNKYTEIYADDISDGKIDGKINETDMTYDTGVTYTTDGTKVTKFEYVDGTITAKLEISTGEWTATDSAN